ncbi:MAG: PTS sugar transporter subunit IIA [Acidobacteriota bacterium]
MTDRTTHDNSLGALVVTHGTLARELTLAAEKIVGHARGLVAVCIDWDEDVGVARRAIEDTLSALGEINGVIIFTDMFGGTPTNISLTFLDPARVEIVTGVNLPMVVKFLNLRDETDVAVAASRLAEKGQQSIQTASGILHVHTAGRGDV